MIKGSRRRGWVRQPGIWLLPLSHGKDCSLSSVHIAPDRTYRSSIADPFSRRSNPPSQFHCLLSTLRFVYREKNVLVSRRKNYLVDRSLFLLIFFLETFLQYSIRIILLLLLCILKDIYSSNKIAFYFFPTANKNVNISGAGELIPGMRDCHVEGIKMIYIRTRTITRHYWRWHPTRITIASWGANAGQIGS